MAATTWEELKRLQQVIRERLRRLHLLGTEKKANEIGKLYDNMAEKISAAFLQAAASSDNEPTNDQIALIIATGQQILEELARARNQIIDRAINEGAARGVRYVEALEQALKTSTAEGALEQAGVRLVFDHTNLAAAEAIKKKIYPDGLNLSKRLWRLDKRTARGLNRLLIDGVKNGRAAVAQAKKIAKMDVSTPAFPKYLQKLEKAARGIAKGTGDQSKFDKILTQVKKEAAKRKAGPLGMRGPTNTLIRQLSKTNAENIDAAIKTWLAKKARYHATVVTRHETNEAFKKAHMDAGEKKDWIVGYRWNLSKSHPRPDICDILATQDLYGLGPGGYSKDKVPETPHPQDMCFLTDIIDPEKLPGTAAQETGGMAAGGRNGGNNGQSKGTGVTGGNGSDIIKIENFQPLGGGVSETFTGTVGGKKYVFKSAKIPEDLDMVRNNLEAELLTAKIFNFLGVKAPQAKFGKFDTGSSIQDLLQVEFVAGESFDAFFRNHGYNKATAIKNLDVTEFRRIQVLDVLVGNGDRHDGNFLVQAGKVVPIDHNLAFATDQVIAKGTSWQKNFLSKIPVDWNHNSLQHILYRNSIGTAVTDDLSAFKEYYQIISEIESQLTDEVIDRFVNDLPDSLADSARKQELSRILKARRDQLRTAFEEHERFLRNPNP